MLQANEQVWQQTTVVYEPGPRRLKAARSAQEQAFAEGKDAESVLNSLPDALRQQLVEKRKLTADVVVEQQGNMRRLVKILAESAR
jgi:hypothetical protein